LANSTSTIGLQWRDNSHDEEGFRIERKSDLTGPWSRITTVSANVTTFSDGRLRAGTGYTYRVRAFNIAGNSSCSNEASARTRDVPPAAPSNLAATAISTCSITLSWQDNSNNEAGFVIETKTIFGWWFYIVLVDADVTGYRVEGLSPGITYYYRVRCYNAAANSGYTNEISVRTHDMPVAAPSRLTAEPLGWSQVLLRWRDNSTNETSFVVERKIGSIGSWLQTAILEANASGYRDTGLSPEILYTYRVRAISPLGPSLYSNEAAVMMPANRLAARLAWQLYE
jgi:hypothetical protein